MKIQYAKLDEDPDAERQEIETAWPDEPHYFDHMAVECAEHDVLHHDGWEGWNEGQSRAFAIYREDGQLLGAYDVVMELEPSYYASERKPKDSDE